MVAASVTVGPAGNVGGRSLAPSTREAGSASVGTVGGGELREGSSGSTRGSEGESTPEGSPRVCRPTGVLPRELTPATGTGTGTGPSIGGGGEGAVSGAARGPARADGPSAGERDGPAPTPGTLGGAGRGVLPREGMRPWSPTPCGAAAGARRGARSGSGRLLRTSVRAVPLAVAAEDRGTAGRGGRALAGADATARVPFGCWAGTWGRGGSLGERGRSGGRDGPAVLRGGALVPVFELLPPGRGGVPALVLPSVLRALRRAAKSSNARPIATRTTSPMSRNETEIRGRAMSAFPPPEGDAVEATWTSSGAPWTRAPRVSITVTWKV